MTHPPTPSFWNFLMKNKKSPNRGLNILQLVQIEVKELVENAFHTLISVLS